MVNWFYRGYSIIKRVKTAGENASLGDDQPLFGTPVRRVSPVMCWCPEFCTWAHVEFEVLSDGADGSEVGGVIEMFLHRLRSDFTEFILHSFSNTDCVHGDACTQGQNHHNLTFNVNINLQELKSDRYSTITWIRDTNHTCSLALTLVDSYRLLWPSWRTLWCRPESVRLWTPVRCGGCCGWRAERPPPLRNCSPPCVWGPDPSSYPSPCSRPRRAQ